MPGCQTIGSLHSGGIWRSCGVVDNVSYVQDSTQALVIIHCPHISTASLTKEWGGGEAKGGI